MGLRRRSMARGRSSQQKRKGPPKRALHHPTGCLEGLRSKALEVRRCGELPLAVGRDVRGAISKVRIGRVHDRIAFELGHSRLVRLQLELAGLGVAFGAVEVSDSDCPFRGRAGVPEKTKVVKDTEAGLPATAYIK